MRCNNKRGRGRCIREGKYLYTDAIFHRDESAAAQRVSRLHGKWYSYARWQNETRRIITVPFIIYYIVLYREFYTIFFDCRHIISTLRAYTLHYNNNIIMLPLKGDIVNHTIRVCIGIVFGDRFSEVLRNDDIASLSTYRTRTKRISQRLQHGTKLSA